MIDRFICWIVNHFSDNEWLAGKERQEAEAIHAAQVTRDFSETLAVPPIWQTRMRGNDE